MHRVRPDRAANASVPRQTRVARVAHRASGSEGQETLYLARVLGQARLPVADPGGVVAWGWRRPGLGLVIQSGLTVDSQGMPVTIGYPHGATARLLLLWICTEAVRTQSRDLRSRPPFSEFLASLGVSLDGAELREQARRMLAAAWTVTRDADGAARERRMSIASHIAWRPDKDNGTFVMPALQLSDPFYAEVTADPIPLEPRVCRAVAASPVQFDIYAWLAAQAANPVDSRFLTWTEIEAQFRVALGPDTRRVFEAGLAAVLDADPGIDVEIQADGLAVNSIPTGLAS